MEKKRLCCLHCCKTRRWQGWLPQRCSFLTMSCHLSVQDRPQPPPTHPQQAEAFPRHLPNPSKHQLSASTSGQPAISLLLTLPMEKQVCWNMGKTFNPWIDALEQLLDTNPRAEQYKATASWNFQCSSPAHSSPALELLGLDREYLLSYHSDLNYAKHTAWYHKGG